MNRYKVGGRYIEIALGGTPPTWSVNGWRFPWISQIDVEQVTDGFAAYTVTIAQGVPIEDGDLGRLDELLCGPTSQGGLIRLIQPRGADLPPGVNVTNWKRAEYTEDDDPRYCHACGAEQ